MFSKPGPLIAQLSTGAGRSLRVAQPGLRLRRRMPCGSCRAAGRGRPRAIARS